MFVSFLHFLSELTDIPIWGLIIALIVFSVITIYILLDKSINKKTQLLSIVYLAGYVVLILCATVFCRPTAHRLRYNFTPFWSYFPDNDGTTHYYEIVLNVLLFMPVGFFCALSLGSIKLWHVLLGTMAFSLFIEVLQLLLQKGVSEFDDVFHNTLGCMMGFLCMKLLLLKKIS